jgi:hypothetical protein
MTSAFMVKRTPPETVKVCDIEISTPAAAQSAPPAAKASPERRGTSMATSREALGSAATARNAMPIRVRVSPR